jgi:hypothetical protein
MRRVMYISIENANQKCDSHMSDVIIRRTERAKRTAIQYPDLIDYIPVVPQSSEVIFL